MARNYRRGKSKRRRPQRTKKIRFINIQRGGMRL